MKNTVSHSVWLMATELRVNPRWRFWFDTFNHVIKTVLKFRKQFEQLLNGQVSVRRDHLISTLFYTLHISRSELMDMSEQIKNVFINPSARVEFDTRAIFLADFNWFEFSYPKSGCQTKVKEPVCPTICSLVEGFGLGWVLWHINLCRLFNVKSIFIHSSILFQTIQFSMNTQFNCQKHFYF